MRAFMHAECKLNKAVLCTQTKTCDGYVYKQTKMEEKFSMEKTENLAEAASQKSLHCTK